MTGVQFYKYSAYGNTFVVIDELSCAALTERQKSAFAAVATDPHGGVGADNLLVIQPFTREVLDEIQEARAYWPSTALDLQIAPDFLFRMFEPDGSEALCCGNGLLCIAMHLFKVRNIRAGRVLTEVPSHAPSVRELATDPNELEFQHAVKLGRPRRMPATLMHVDAAARSYEAVCVLHPLPVALSSRARLPASISLFSHATYTGEPHVVVVDDPQHPSALRTLYEHVMAEPERGGGSGGRVTRALEIDPDLLDELGLSINRESRALFPQGINVSFARLRSHDQVVEYRCFERGIFKETLACGTAAVAITAVLCQLGRTDGHELIFWPKRSRGNPFYSNARLQVRRDADGEYWLRGQARKIFEATLRTSEYPILRMTRPPPKV